MFSKIGLLAKIGKLGKKRFSTLCMRATVIVSLAFLLPVLLSATKSYKEKLHEYVHRMPKMELHIHLEGSIAPETIIEIAKRNNVDVPFKNKDEFRELCKSIKNFDDFVAIYRIIQSCLKKPDDFTQIAYEYGKEAARQNICYSEAMVSFDSDFLMSGLAWQEIVKALNKGRKRAQEEFGISWNWIFANAHPEKVSPDTFVDIMVQLRNEKAGVVAMAVLEPLFNKPLPKEYQRAFNRAINIKLPIIPHTGEFNGPQNIRNALNACQTKRIDHGVQCIQDKELMSYLAKKQISLDVCITSNICLHDFPDYGHHPVRKLFDAGLRVNVSTDDPAIFGIDLNGEYDHLIDDYSFTIDELEKISWNAIWASLLSHKYKKMFKRIFKAECAKLRKEIFGEEKAEQKIKSEADELHEEIFGV